MAAADGRSARRVLLTGATGYLGGLIAKTLLVHEDVDIVALVREKYDAEGFWGPIRREIVSADGGFDPAYLDRVVIEPLPPVEEIDRLDPVLERHGVSEVIHCAGCVDYFDAETLQYVNVGLTTALLDLAARIGVERFVYVSTAFSSGYLDDLVPEALHDGRGEDPTDYTRTKREAEHVVAGGTVPFQILRPPIVIGNSRDGRYGGKRYGLYQLWLGMERLLFNEWHPEVHYVAPRVPMPLLHEDAFQDAFLGAYRHLPDGTIFNMVPDELPDLRDIAEMWYLGCMAPERIYYYETLAQVPLLDINRRQRAFLGMASTNIEIASHNWRFERSAAAVLGRHGVPVADTTLATLGVCQDRFKRSSERIRDFMVANAHRFGKTPEVIEPCLNATAS